MSTTITTATHIEALISVTAAVLWLVIIATLHVIKPQLRPSAHMISEYAIKPKGWIMQVAFFCIAVSCLALVVATWPYISHAGLILLAIDGLAFAGAGMFVTDPPSITRRFQTQNGVLHIIFSLIVIPLFPVTATILGISMSGNDVWASVHLWFPVLSVLVWAGFFGFMGCSAIYSAMRKKAPVGYYQRFMALAYATWLIVVASVMI